MQKSIPSRSLTVRERVDSEIIRRVGKWFTVREFQDKLSINPSTLKPLIMKYARQRLLKRRQVKGTARAVQFTAAAGSVAGFKKLLLKNMPYRPFRNRSSAPMQRKRSKSKRS